jgi:hypothetical protein
MKNIDLLTASPLPHTVIETIVPAFQPSSSSSTAAAMSSSDDSEGEEQLEGKSRILR